jgi:hypothetical protein
VYSLGDGNEEGLEVLGVLDEVLLGDNLCERLDREIARLLALHLDKGALRKVIVRQFGLRSIVDGCDILVECMSRSMALQ